MKNLNAADAPEMPCTLVWTTKNIQGFVYKVAEANGVTYFIRYVRERDYHHLSTTRVGCLEGSLIGGFDTEWDASQMAERIAARVAAEVK